MELGDSVVVLHDGPRLWLPVDDDGLMRAFRHPLPDDFTLEDPAYDWEAIFTFLPEEILVPVRACWAIAVVPHGSTGRPARISSFDAELPSELPDPTGPLGRLAEARLGRVNEYAWQGRIGDPETLIGLLAIAHDRVKNGGRGKG